LKIVPGNFEDPRVISLLRLHLQGMHANSPPGSVYALDLSELKAANISFFTVWEGETLLGMGALKEIDATSGEIKSMRTDPKHLRKGVAEALLEHLIVTAKSRGYRRLSLETGSGPAFEPALALYHKRGFTMGRPFGGYMPTEFNQFFHLDLGHLEQ
jgi:putative acetyltransferase